MLPEKREALWGQWRRQIRPQPFPFLGLTVAHTGGTPVAVIGDKDHEAQLAIDLHPRLHTAEGPTRQRLPLGPREPYDLVFDHPASFLHVQIAHGTVAEVVLRASHPMHATRSEIKEVSVVHVGFVEDDDFAFLLSGAQFTSAFVVTFPSRIDDGKGGQKAAQAQTQVHLRRSLASAMLSPVHAIGHEFHDGQVNGMDAHFESVQQRASAASTTSTLATEARAQPGAEFRTLEQAFSASEKANLKLLGEARNRKR